jgi:[CysO sulfur-carrier protein]-S-L-cysteine hydrolase
MRVHISRDVLDAILRHARAEAPNECCGLLVGTRRCIDESVPTRNVVASPTRYEVDPREHIALIRRLRGTDREIVGTYHSHPASPPVPSPTDVAQAFYPDFAYLIVSLEETKTAIRGYRIRLGNVDPLDLVVVP